MKRFFITIFLSGVCCALFLRRISGFLSFGHNSNVGHAGNVINDGKTGNMYFSSCKYGLIILLIVIPHISAAKIDIGDIAKSSLPAIVVIETPTSTGSGVIIDNSGVVVTNFHVVSNALSIKVELSNGDSFDAISIIDYDENKDIALLKLKGFDLPSVQMGNSNSVEVGDDVVVMGAPRGFEQSVTRGIVSAIRDSESGYRLIQTDAAISPGSSGGGVFNDTGNLIGISVSFIKDAQNVNFVVPINYVQGMFSVKPKFTLKEFLALQNIEGTTASGASFASSGYSFGDFISALEARMDVKFSYSSDDEVWYLLEGNKMFTTTEVDGIVVSSIYEVDEEKFSQQQLHKFLEKSYLSNYGKVGISDSGSLVVLNESPFIGLTQEYFTAVITALFDLNNEVKSVLSNANEQQSSVNNSELNVSDLSTTNKPPLSSDASILQYPTKSYNDEKFLVRFDPDRWELDKENTVSVLNDVQYVGGDVWLKIIAEEIELAYEPLLEIIISHAHEADPNAKLISKGFRDVNGKRIMWARIDAEVSGLSVVYYYHIYTGSEGTIQLIGFTTSNIFEKRVKVIEEVFASFIVQP